MDGLIVVDLPPEEDDELCRPALAAGLNFIRLATPTTDDTRLPAVLKNTSGFVYYVSMTGITGAAIRNRAAVRSYEEALKVELPENIKQIVIRQHIEIKSAHDRIRALERVGSKR